ncbi:MAG: glycosyltransferase [Chloroflexota bacterium]
MIIGAFETPSVSVVVVNYNGKHHLEACLMSLLDMDYPRDRLELILVDNGSSDGSVSYVHDRFPSVRVVENEGNLGFARANNIGARFASGELLAMLNNDTKVDRKWLTGLVAELRPSEGIVCAGSVILSWDGRLIDFMGGGLNFYGHGMQPGFGTRHCPDTSNQCPRLVPFACGGAMLIDRQTFLEVGGFDEDYFAFFEDVDLGWRLWLSGYKVVLVSKAIVYHRHHGTARKIPAHQLHVLYERNALMTLFKNYEQRNLDKVLPAALMLLVERELLQSGVDREAFRLGSRDRKATQKVARVGLAGLVAVDDLIQHLDEVLRKRQEVQARRRRSDAEVFAVWDVALDDPSFPGGEYLRAQRKLMAAMKLENYLPVPTRKHVLLLCHEPIGERMAGPAIRYWELACALSKEFDVCLGHPGQPGLAGRGFTVSTYDRAQYETLAAVVDWADVIVSYGYLLGIFPQLADAGKPLVADIYDVFILENLEHHRYLSLADQERVATANLSDLNGELKSADFYLCASERQRDYWLGMLVANGRLGPRTYAADRTLRSLIDVVPFGVQSSSPQRNGSVLKGVHPQIQQSDKLLIWGGGLWDWFDPQTLVRALALIRDRRSDVKLYFMAKQHLDPDTVPEMRAATETMALSRDLGLLDSHVFFGDWIPYDRRSDYLLEADLGISLHLDGAETRFAFRTRLLDYIWAALPIVTTGGDVLGDLVDSHGLGRVVRPGDVEGVAEAILALLAEENLRERLLPKFAGVAESLTWEKATEPLRRYLREPRFAPDREAGLERVGAADRKTPYRALPVKALGILREGGAKSLLWEARQYMRWWWLYRK